MGRDQRVSGAPGDFAAAIENDRLRRLYLYWDEKRRDRLFPARRDLDPLDFPYALGKIMLIDVSHDPLQFRFRLYGTELVDRMGIDVTGLSLDKHPMPEFRDFLGRGWREAIDGRRPLHVFFDRMVDERQRRFESLRLPLSSDGTTIDMLMVAVATRD